MTAAANDWVAYWDGLGEGRLLFTPEAEEFARNLRSVVPLDPALRVLDFGCGYGHVSALIAADVGPLRYWDAAEGMRAAAGRNLARFPNAAVWDESPAMAFDLILVNSVVQYMTRDEIGVRLRQWRGSLSPSGRVVLSDLIPPGHSTVSDVWSLLRFSLRRGYFVRALRNTLAERPRYAAVSRDRPLLHIGRDELVPRARDAGFRVEYLPRNLTHFRGRQTCILTPVPE